MNEKIDISAELDLASNLWGKLRPKIRKQIQDYVNNPTVEKWNDAHGIILNNQDWTTLWQAVIAIDPTFPRVGRSETLQGKMIKDWDRIPDAETIKQALAYATH